MSLETSTEAVSVPLNLYRVSSPGIARVISNDRLTPENSDDVRHIVLDLTEIDYRFVEGQSMGILAPGLNEHGKPNKLRLYSIASTRLGDDGTGRTASLCVKRVVYSDPETGEERRGLASNYLCDLAPGDEVSVTGPAGRTFLLPRDPASNLIMVATGTGIAPFRAFLRRIFRETDGWTGSVYLVFGVRTQAECLYLSELEEFRRHPNFHLLTAFSREQTTADGRRMYVQHRIAEQVSDLWNLLERNSTFLYICGLKGMEAGITSAFETHARALQRDFPSMWKDMAHNGRLHIETY